MRTAIFPGTFDPLTFGHQDIAERALRYCDKLIIAIGQQSQKSGLLPIEARIKLIHQCFENHPAIQVKPLNGLLIDFSLKHNADTIIRGIRGTVDTEYELQLAQMNAHMAPEIDTVFLPTRAQWQHVSSTWVREIAKTNPAQLHHFVPALLIDALTDKG